MSEPRTDTETFRLGPFRIDGLGKRLMCGETRLDVDAPQVDVLVCLARAYPAIVSKDRLIEQVWGGRFVTDAALHKSISTLRRTLSDTGDGTEWIETRHRRGYQLSRAPEWLIADAAPVDASRAPATEATPVDDLEPDIAPVPTARRRLRTLRWILVAVFLFGAAVAILRWPDGPVPEGPVPEGPVREDPGQPDVVAYAAIDPRTKASLEAMDQAQLVDTIRRALGDDDSLVVAGIEVLRSPGRAATDPDSIPLADKFAGIRDYRLGAFDSAMTWYRRALAGFEASNNTREQGNVLNNMGILFSETGQDPDRAATWFRQSLAIREAQGDKAAVLASHKNMANLWLVASRFDEAAAAVDAFVAAAEQLGQPGDRVDALLLRGDVALAQGDPRAREWFDEARRLAVSGGLALAAASAEQRLGRVALESGDGHGARRYFMAAHAFYAQSDEIHQRAVVSYNLATADEAIGDTASALDHYASAADNAPESGSSLRVDALLGQSRMYRRLGQSDAARSALDAAQREAAILGNPGAIAAVLLARSVDALLAGEATAARAFLVEARTSAGPSIQRAFATELVIQEAWVAMAHGDFVSARTELDRYAAAAPDFGARLAPIRALAQVGAGDVPAALASSITVGSGSGAVAPAEASTLHDARRSREIPLAALAGLIIGVFCTALWHRRRTR